MQAVGGRVRVTESVEIGNALDELLGVRGATLAALVDGAGDLVASRSRDGAMLERAAKVLTSALAAATALGELVPVEDGVTELERPKQVMLNLDTGPLLFVPLSNSDRVVVVGVASDADLGRARLAVKGLLSRFEKLAAGA